MMGSCKHCGAEKKLRKDFYCSQSCFNKHTKAAPITGYKKCLMCGKDFPFREQAKKRSSFCKRLGIMIGSINQKFCSSKCSICFKNKYNNPAQTISGRNKISLSAKKRGTEHMRTDEARIKQRLSISGQGHWNWQGGKTKHSKTLRNSFEMKKWRKLVFERDNYTCIWCGAKNYKGLGKTIKLQADHIKPFALYPELIFDINNGRTLCIDCHKKTDTHSGKIKTYKKLML